MIDVLKIKWVKFSLFSQNAILQFLTTLLYKRNKAPRKILLFRTGSIGDNICAFPSIVALRKHFVSSEIDILTTAGGKNLISMQRLLSSDYYNQIIDYESYTPAQLFKYIKKQRYDLVIELPQNMVTLIPQLRNILFFRIAGIASGWGWQVVTCQSFRQTQDRQTSFQRENIRLKEILKSNAVNDVADDTYPLNITTDDFEIVDRLIQKKGLNERKMIAFVPGAKRPQNRYPLDRFSVLAQWVVSRGYQVVIIGGPDDTDRGKFLERTDSVTSMCGLLTPIQSAALLSKCFITVSNDTGPMHLSYAVSTPVVGIFSSRDFKQKWFPPEGQSKVLRNNDIHCSLCLSETCADNICMKGISVEDIKQQFVELEMQLR